MGVLTRPRKLKDVGECASMHVFVVEYLREHTRASSRLWCHISIIFLVQVVGFTWNFATGITCIIFSCFSMCATLVWEHCIFFHPLTWFGGLALLGHHRAISLYEHCFFPLSPWFFQTTPLVFLFIYITTFPHCTYSDSTGSF